MSGWYAGWITRPRVGKVAGAVAPIGATSTSITPHGGASGGVTIGSVVPETSTSTRSERVGKGSKGGTALPNLPDIFSPIDGGDKGSGGSPAKGRAGAGGGGSRSGTQRSRPGSESTDGAVTRRKTNRRVAFEGSAGAAAKAALSSTSAGSLAQYQHHWTVMHEDATALVRKYLAPDFVDQPVNRCVISKWSVRALSSFCVAPVHPRSTRTPTPQYRTLRLRTVRRGL